MWRRTFLPSGIDESCTSTFAIAKTSAEALMLTRKSAVIFSKNISNQHHYHFRSTLNGCLCCSSGQGAKCSDHKVREDFIRNFPGITLVFTEVRDHRRRLAIGRCTLVSFLLYR